MKPDASDEELLKRFVTGDRSALGVLARRYERPLLGLASGLLGGPEPLARDAVQETWLRVIRFGGGFNGRAGFKTWLYRIAVNQCRSMMSARAAGSKIVERERIDDEPRAADRPESTAERVEQGDALRGAVESLSSDQRLIVLLCYHEGMTHTEAAAILEIPVGTLKSRLHAALNELRGRLTDGGS